MAEMPEYRVLFDELVSLLADADASSKRVRGRRFERVLNGLLEAEALKPRTSYRPTGEEVDGSFVFENRVYLLEAKWQAAPLPASALHTFKGKVDGKLVGTIGICISMSGFGDASADALRFGQTVNVLLFDGGEISACIRGTESFSHALRAKLRAAAEEGLAYAPRRVQHVERDLSGDVTSKTDGPERAPRLDGRTLVIVCEGPRDAVLLGGLAKRLMRHLGLTGDVSVFPAIGKAPLG
jgi:hypothetical protein